MVFIPSLRHIAKNAVITALWFLGRYTKALHEIREPMILKYHRTRASDRGVASSTDFFEFERGVSACHLEAQMRLISRYRRPIGMDELAEALRSGKALPERAVALTFDDGYIDNYEVAFPILRRYKIPATFYVCPGLMDSALGFWWDSIYSCFRITKKPVFDLESLAMCLPISRSSKDLVFTIKTIREKEQAAQAVISMAKQVPVETTPAIIRALANALDVPESQARSAASTMDWIHIKEMIEHGMDIGSHTMTHPMMSQISDRQLAQEVRASRARLQDELGRAVNGFVYPSGDYHDKAREVVKQAGHWYACTSESGFVTSSSDPYLLKRVNISDANMALSCREIILTHNRHLRGR